MDMYVNKLLNNKTYDRFFLHGIDNKEDVIEGIIYYSLQEVYANHKNENLYELSNEKLMSEIIEKAVPKYVQFYRFVVMNDKFTEHFENNDVNLEQMKREIIQTIRRLLSDKRKIQIKDEKGNYKSILLDRMVITKAGIYFTRGEIDAIGLNQNCYYQYKQDKQEKKKEDCIQNYYEYDEKGNIKNPRGVQGELAWTRQIYNILGDLAKLEQLDGVRYYDSWLHTKLERAKNQDPPDFNIISLIERACQLFENRTKSMLGREIGE